MWSYSRLLHKTQETLHNQKENFWEFCLLGNWAHKLLMPFLDMACSKNMLKQERCRMLNCTYAQLPYIIKNLLLLWNDVDRLMKELIHICRILGQTIVPWRLGDGAGIGWKGVNGGKGGHICDIFNNKDTKLKYLITCLMYPSWQLGYVINAFPYVWKVPFRQSTFCSVNV